MHIIEIFKLLPSITLLLLFSGGGDVKKSKSKKETELFKHKIKNKYNIYMYKLYSDVKIEMCI